MQMKYRSFRKFPAAIACGIAALGLSVACSGPSSQASRPNILFIMSDDHATNAISSYGSRINKTPNIDRLATQGMRLENCFVTNSICTPSRAAILTGQYSHLNGVYTLSDPLDPERANVAKQLQAAGYQTAVIGKWHLKTDPAGFDYWNVLPGQGRYHNPMLREIGGEEPREHQGFSTDVITDFSLDWLKRRDPEKPFFLMTQFKAPHRSWEPAEKYATLYEDVEIPEPDTLFDDYRNRSRAARDATMRVGEHMVFKDLKRDPPPNLKGMALRKWAYQYYIKDYLRCVASVDEIVGRLLDYLDENGLTENTVVIYTADQGFFLGEHGYYDKRFMYEESLRMPFIVRYPREIEPGSVNGGMVLNVDFAPTFLDYAQASPLPGVQGRSIRPLLKTGETPADWRKSMYYRYWMHLAHHGVPAHYGVRTERYKLIYFYGDPLGTAGSIDKPTEPEWEMFDLEKDPQELNNVYDAPAYAEVLKELKAELERLRRELGDTER